MTVDEAKIKEDLYEVLSEKNSKNKIVLNV